MQGAHCHGIHRHHRSADGEAEQHDQPSRPAFRPFLRLKEVHLSVAQAKETFTGSRSTVRSISKSRASTKPVAPAMIETGKISRPVL